MLGIDIGEDSIKLVVMRRRRRGWTLLAFVVQRLPVADSSRPALASVALRDALGAALRQLPGKVRDAAVALNSDEAVTRVIRLDAGMDDHDIENQLAVEADQHLPFALSDTSIDFCRLPEGAGAGTSGQDVLMVACRSDCVAKRVSLLAEFGIRPAVVDLDALALYRIAGGHGSVGPTVMLDLGANGFRLHAFAGGRPVYSRAHLLAAAVDPLGQTAQHDPQRIARLLQEIRRAFQLLLISTACKDLAGITLVGGLASLPGLAANISKVCDRPAVVMPPPDVNLHPRIECAHWQATAPNLALAGALAMRER